MRNLRCALLAALIVASSGCSIMEPSFYSSEALHARVIAAQTGLPVEGAVVIVVWTLQQPLEHGRDFRSLRTARALTDSEGGVHIERWGAEYPGEHWSVEGSSPRAYIFKQGHAFRVVSNYTTSLGGFTCRGSKLARVSRGLGAHTRSPIVVSWNGCEITLEPIAESPVGYATRLGFIRRELCSPEPHAECWRPLQSYFSQEAQRLRALGVPEHRLRDLDEETEALD